MAPALLVQRRGVSVFHAGAVEVAGRACLFVGHPGDGKSTLSAFLASRGYPFVSDNLLGVLVRDGMPSVLPGRASIRLRLDAASRLISSLSYQDQHLTADNKTEVALNGTRQEPLTPSTIYFFQPGEKVDSTPLSPVDCFRLLSEHTFAVRTLGILDPKRHFEAVSALARTCDAYTLCRGNSFDQLPEVARILEEHAGLSGPPAASHPA